MSSSDRTANKEPQKTASEAPKQAQTTRSAGVAVNATPTELLTEDGEVEAVSSHDRVLIWRLMVLQDDGYSDSGFGTDNSYV